MRVGLALCILVVLIILHCPVLLMQYSMNCYHNSYLCINLFAGKITQRGNDENKTALLDCSKDELASVDSISVLQPQLCSLAGKFT